MDLLTVHETAQLLKVAPITVRRYIAAGRLPAVKVGRGVRIRREAIGELLTPVEIEPRRRSVATLEEDRVPVEHSLLRIARIAGSVQGADGPTTDFASDKYACLAEVYRPVNE